MGRTFVRSMAEGAIIAGIGALAILAFLYDLYPGNEGNWRVTAAVVTIFAGTSIIFSRDRVGSRLFRLASLSVVAFLIIYDGLDVLVDPFLKADWPVALVAFLAVLRLESMFIILLFDEG